MTRVASRPALVLALLLTASFSIATFLQPRTEGWSRRAQSKNLLSLLFGDGRRLFANHFYTQADVYFHSGYYPTIFDAQAAGEKRNSEMVSAAEEGESHHDEPGHKDAECEMDFMGRPRDWVEAFGRRFRITEHTHLEKGGEKEILPWLRLSAELDPQRIDTYTVAAYWLCSLGKVKDAEVFLREGLENNPSSYEILFELARLADEKQSDAFRARNLCRLALKRWKEREAGKSDPDVLAYEKIAYRLGILEEKLGNLKDAIVYFQMARAASSDGQHIQEKIDELTAQLANPKPPR